MANLAKFLDNSAAWKRQYNGKDGTIWVRVKRFDAPLTPIPVESFAPIPPGK